MAELWRTPDWAISDTHFGHEKIVGLCDRPANHEELMLERWRQVVLPTDVVLHLGDLWWKDWRRWTPIVACLPGLKFLIRGNHDNATRAKYRNAGFTLVEAFVEDGVAFTHRPMYDDARYHEVDLDGWTTNVHGHVHNNYHHPNEGSPIEGRRYVNVSVEAIDYRPLGVSRR